MIKEPETPDLSLSEGVPTSVGSRAHPAEEYHAEATPSESDKPFAEVRRIARGALADDERREGASR